MCMRTTPAPDLAATSAMLRIAQQRRDVVDDIRPASEGLLRHSSFRGIDGDDDVASGPEAANHGDNPSQFLLWRPPSRPRGGGFAADVDDLGAFAFHRSACATAASGSKNLPPSENESGVTLSTPMMTP